MQEFRRETLSKVRAGGGEGAGLALPQDLPGMKVPGFACGSACLLGEEHSCESALTVLRS